MSFTISTNRHRKKREKAVFQMCIINAVILQNLSAWVLSWQAKILPLDNFVSKSRLPLLLLFCIIRLSLRLIKLTILWRENILRSVHLASSGCFSFSSPYNYAFIGCLQYLFLKGAPKGKTFEKSFSLHLIIRSNSVRNATISLKAPTLTSYPLMQRKYIHQKENIIKREMSCGIFWYYQKFLVRSES